MSEVNMKIALVPLVYNSTTNKTIFCNPYEDFSAHESDSFKLYLETLYQIADDSKNDIFSKI
jgi:hypothetical protein